MDYQRNKNASHETLKHCANAWRLSDTKVDHLCIAIHDYQNSLQDCQARAQIAERAGQSVDWNAIQHPGGNLFNTLQKSNAFNMLTTRWHSCQLELTTPPTPA